MNDSQTSDLAGHVAISNDPGKDCDRGYLLQVMANPMVA